MTTSITINQFIEFRKNISVIDVRTPDEYQQGHIPDAVNLPIFTQEERAVVGTTYKQKGREKAILIGFDFVGSKWRGFIEQALKIAPDKKIIIHCWRGGMRSNAMAWALDFYGFETYILEGGYKSFRNWALNSFNNPLRLKIVGGMTGSQKTQMLQSMTKKGEQIIDLEGLANHEGSAFGTLGSKIQPTQEQFENELAIHIASLNPLKNIWIEDESRTIGKRVIPEPLWQQMRVHQLVEIRMDYQRRFDFLLEKYGYLDKEFLKEATSHISKRLGPLKTKEAFKAIEEDRMFDFITITMEYYDKTYHKCFESKIQERIIPLEIYQESIEECADKIIRLISNN